MAPKQIEKIDQRGLKEENGNNSSTSKQKAKILDRIAL